MSERARTKIGRYSMTPLWLALNPDVGHIALRLFVILAAKYADRDDNTCFPSRRTLATDLRLAALSTVDAAIAQLKAAGALVVKHQYHPNGNFKTSMYTLMFDDPNFDTIQVAMEPDTAADEASDPTTH